VRHLDHHFCQPGWIARSDDHWHGVLYELVADEEWIIDGNCASSLELRVRRADTVIELALPRSTCLRRALTRVIRPGHRHHQAEGCPERLDPEFMRWIRRFPRDSAATPRDTGCAR
jgi:adenylate kinase family enzyme